MYYWLQYYFKYISTLYPLQLPRTSLRILCLSSESSNTDLFPTARAYLSFPSPISNPSHFSMQVSTRPPSSRRTSHSEMRGRAPLPVSSGAQNPQNGHSRNPSALDVARSPPNQSNKSTSLTSIYSYQSLQLYPECELILLQSSI